MILVLFYVQSALAITTVETTVQENRINPPRAESSATLTRPSAMFLLHRC